MRDTRKRRRKSTRSKKHYNLEKRMAARKRRAKMEEFRDQANVREKVGSAIILVPRILSWVLPVLISVLLAYFLVDRYGQRVSTIGDSMKPVLSNGDVVLVNRKAYQGRDAQRGDIVVFLPKDNKNKYYYMKRVIGLPGETVEVLENTIFINGEKLEEPYETTNIDDIGLLSSPVTLGKDEYFVLGDDRQNSEDSRHENIGNVKKEELFGKAWFILSPGSHLGFLR